MSMKLSNIYLLFIALPFLFITGCTNSSNEFSNVTKQFEDSVKGESALCFYPSTIQMLNTNKDTAFNKVFRDIKKLKVIRFPRSSDSTRNIIASDWAEKVRSEEYVDLLRFKQGKQDFMVFLYKHNDEPKKFFGIVSDSTQVLMVDLVGTIPVKYITDMAKGDFDLGGFGSVLNFNKSSQNNKNRKK